MGDHRLSTWEGLSTVQEYSATDIREKLPLEWVLGQLYGMWGVGSIKVSCPMPDHGDSTPSFNLWSPGERGHYTRFGCYGCGVKGDVLDLIQLNKGVGFGEALDLAYREFLPQFLEGEYEVQIPQVAEVDREGMEEIYLGLLEQRISEVPITAFLTRKGLLYEEGLKEHAWQEWRWRGHPLIQAVSMPHYDHAGVLTGVKFRHILRRENKWGIKGSSYPCLYGAWRDKGRQDVLLCEGESDTVLASCQLGFSVAAAIDVLGVPSGVKQRPTEGQLLQLSGRKIWMAFDGDEAGQSAVGMWCDAIWDYSPGETEVKLLTIPAGEDIGSCGIHVMDLLERSGYGL